MLVETRYAKSGDAHIAYQVVGDGPIDLVFVLGWVFTFEGAWEEPSFANFLSRLASFTRLIIFDKRGTGLSDRITTVTTIEQRMDDIRAVMDAAGSKQAVFFGQSEGCATSALFAATYPERTTALVLYGTFIGRRSTWDPTEKPNSAEEDRQFHEMMRKEWGGPFALKAWIPSLAGDERFREWWASYLRRSVSPAGAVAITQMLDQVNIKDILPSIRVPTLILHRIHDAIITIEHSRYVAAHIPGAKLVELPGNDHWFFVDSTHTIIDEVEEFLTGARPVPERDRVLATVLFTDIVSSTEHAARLGDERWRELRERHHALVRRELTRFRGREVETAGDSFLATFDGPARAIRCACAISDGMRALGISIRAGLHTGECEVIEDKLGGIAVHIGARVAALAQANEVLVSSTVKDLVTGSSIQFTERGTYTLKGLPGEWRLYAVER